MGQVIELVRPRTVTTDGAGLVWRAGLVWLGEVADRSGLTAGFSRALARRPVGECLWVASTVGGW
jgi:hypothetical protein